MATLEQETQVRNQLKDVLKELATYTASDLARKDLSPDVNFESGVIFFSRTIRLFQALQEAELEDIPNQRLNELLSAATQTRDRFSKIKTFSLRQYPANPIAIRDQFINEIRDSYDDIFNKVSPTVAFTVRKGIDFQRLEEQAKAALERIESLSAEHKKALEKSRSDSESLVREVQRFAQEAGVTKEAVHFKTEADNHENAAKQWLIGTIAIGVVTLIAAIASWIFFAWRLKDLNATQNVQLTVSKIIILSIMFSATIWAGKTYRAHRHNAVVNRHRQNALSTFKAFVEATTDEPTKMPCCFRPHSASLLHNRLVTSPQAIQTLEEFPKF
jgi:hypothetical protein